MRPTDFREMIRQAGRVPAERYTDYKIKQVFGKDDSPVDALDLVGDNVEEIFGSYKKLVQMDEYRYEHPTSNKGRELPADQGNVIV